MARKSGWQQFADNFTSMYSTVNKFGKEGADRDIMDQEAEEQFNDKGLSTGFSMGGKNYGSMDEVNMAKYQGLSDNAARYGDSKGALNMQEKMATIRSKGLSNQYDFKSMQTRLDQLESNVDKTGSEIENLDSRSNQIDVDTDFKIDTADVRKEQLNQNVNKTIVDIDNVIEGTKGKELTNQQKEIDVQTSTMAWKINEPLNNALLEHSSTKWGSAEESKKALIEIYGLHGDKDGKGAAMVKNMDASKINGILREANVNSAKIQAMLSNPNEGVGAVAAWIGVNDGIEGTDAEVFTLADGRHVIASAFTDSSGVTVPLEPYYVEGGSAEELRANVQLFATPGGSVQLANQMDTFRKNKAGLKKTKAETEKLTTEAGTAARNIPSEQHKLAMSKFMENQDGLYQRAYRKAQKSGLDADWLNVEKIRADYERDLNLSRTSGGLRPNANPAPGDNSGFSNMRKKTN
jgi:hypothetical protein